MQVFPGWKLVGNEIIDDVGQDWYEFRKKFDGRDDQLYMMINRNSKYINSCSTDINSIYPQGTDTVPVDIYILDFNEMDDTTIIPSMKYDPSQWQIYGVVKQSSFNHDVFLDYVSEEIRFAKNRIANTSNQHIIDVYTQYIIDIQIAADKEILRDYMNPLYANLPQPPRL